MFSLPPLDTNALAGIIAGAGAILVRLVENLVHRISGTSAKTQVANQADDQRLRQDMREEIYMLREDNAKLRKDVDMWREKYWEVHTQSEVNEQRVNVLDNEVLVLADRLDQLSMSLTPPPLLISGSRE